MRKQEVWGLVGESASGKSVIGQALMGVVAKPAGRIVSGEILFKGEDILKKSPKEVQKIRGSEIAFIPRTRPPPSTRFYSRVPDLGGIQVPPVPSG